MQILRHYENTPDDVRNGVVVMGNFDGVHRGHQAVIGAGAALAKARSAPLIVLTFEPHPRSFFRPHDPSFRLTSFRNKAHHIEALGVDALVVLNFDEALSRLTAAEFIQQVIVDGLGVRDLVVGYDFRFGNKRSGDAAFLEKCAAKNGYTLQVVEPVATADSEVFSSTHIREMLIAGKPGQAAAMLGRPFEIEGRVQPGDQRGRLLGFPTANLPLGDYLRPAQGVYAIRAGLETEDGFVWRDGVANFGNRPTVDGTTTLLETHLFDFDADIYGANLRVALIEFLRPEKKFDGLDALKAQISEDSATARQILRVRAAGAS
ncbi:MAG: bifunctional riboflavin kinase/FAD synthetase [Alphaproteobacteria bacterium]|nr:bifunctional riboflavin kinase/FAD synthetase [Alphaproteobacteria bacterium]